MTRCGRDAVDHRAFEESRMHRVATHLGAEPRPVQRHRLGEQADAGVGSNAVAALPSGEQALVYLLICLRQMALAPSKISSACPARSRSRFPQRICTPI